MRLAVADRQVVEQAHLVAGDVDELEVLRIERADRVKRSIDILFIATTYLPSGLTVSPSAATQVPDVVVDAELVEDLQVLHVPLGDLALEEEARVRVAVAVELGVERPQAELDLSADRVLEGQDRDAEGVLALERLARDERLDLREVVDRGVRVELAGDDDGRAVGRDVAAVGALGLADEREHALVRGGLERDHAEALDGRRLAGGDELLGLLPVDDVQVVHVVLRRAALDRRACPAASRPWPSRC